MGFAVDTLLKSSVSGTWAFTSSPTNTNFPPNIPEGIATREVSVRELPGIIDIVAGTEARVWPPVGLASFARLILFSQGAMAVALPRFVTVQDTGIISPAEAATGTWTSVKRRSGNDS
jgi:hypothetical protein